MKRPFYIGTQHSGAGHGIYRSELDLGSGTLTEPRLVTRLADPSFVALHPVLDVIYTCSETTAIDACVVSFRMGPDGALVETSRQPTGGDYPCYVSTDRAGTSLFVANYGGGSIGAYPLDPSGAVGPVRMFERFDGARPPHAHWIRTDPTDRFFMAVDLGLDRILVYAIEAARTSAEARPVSTFESPSGYGPRHIAFHPGGHFAFLVHEYANVLIALRWSDAGRLTESFSLSTLPEGFRDESVAAEVAVHPSGRFVFVSNRGHDSIATFAFDDRLATLTLVCHTPCGGHWPRHFRLDPSGQFLLVANQRSGSVVPFRVHEADGTLTPCGPAIGIEAASCVTFAHR